jgi:hypothetical protein
VIQSKERVIDGGFEFPLTGATTALSFHGAMLGLREGSLDPARVSWVLIRKDPRLGMKACRHFLKQGLSYRRAEIFSMPESLASVPGPKPLGRHLGYGNAEDLASFCTHNQGNTHRAVFGVNRTFHFIKLKFSGALVRRKGLSPLTLLGFSLLSFLG